MSDLRIRRATIDDLDALRAIWVAMQLPADNLEKRLKEFQVAEADGQVVGAIGLLFSGTAALLHHEGYSDFSYADRARQLFWDRIQTLAANHGVFRIWTLENSPFWLRWGFQPANEEILARLPEAWKTAGAWFTLPLKNEEAVTAALESRFAGFMDTEKEQTARITEKAKSLTTFITIAGFTIGIFCIGVAVYLFLKRNPFAQ